MRFPTRAVGANESGNTVHACSRPFKNAQPEAFVKTIELEAPPDTARSFCSGNVGKHADDFAKDAIALGRPDLHLRPAVFGNACAEIALASHVALHLADA